MVLIVFLSATDSILLYVELIQCNPSLQSLTSRQVGTNYYALQSHKNALNMQLSLIQPY